MQDPDDHAGAAALAICESLLLALKDHKILPQSEIIGVLHDAAMSHEGTHGTAEATMRHRAVAALIRRLITNDIFPRQR